MDFLDEIGFEPFLGIATFLIFLGSFAPWEHVSAVGPIAPNQPIWSVSSNALSSWHGAIAIIGALLTMFATTVSYRMYRVNLLQKYRPHTDGTLGAVGSIMALVGAFAFFATLGSGAVPTWGIYVTIIGGVLGLISSLGLYREGASPIPSGASEIRGRTTSATSTPKYDTSDRILKVDGNYFLSSLKKSYSELATGLGNGFEGII